MGCGAAKTWVKPPALVPQIKFLLIFDVGQTLFNNPEGYDQLLDRQAAAFFKIMLERMQSMKPEDRAKTGLAPIRLDDVAAAAPDWQLKFTNKFRSLRVAAREKKNKEYVGEETAVESELFSLLVTDDCFECSLGKTLTPETEKTLHGFCTSVAGDVKCAVTKYEPFDKVGEVLEELKRDGVVLTICANSQHPRAVRSALETLKYTGLFEKVILSGEVGMRKPNQAMADMIRKDYPAYNSYEMCMIGDMLDRDILCGSKANMRTLWFVRKPFDPQQNYSKLTEVRPDFMFTQYRQLPALVKLMARDAEFIRAAGQDEQGYRQNYTLLPSQKGLRCAYYFPKKKDAEMAEKSVTRSNDQVLFFPLLPDCDLAKQGPFDVLLHKAADLMVAELQKKANRRFSELKDYAEKCKAVMVSLDPLEQVRLTMLRTTTNELLEKAFQSEGMQKVCQKHGIQIKIPYSRTLINADPEDSHKKILDDVLGKKADYPLFIKLSESCQTPEAHTLCVCTNADGLKKGLETAVYKGKELIVQQFVKHYATVFKVYTAGSYISYHCKKSLPSDMPIGPLGVFDSQKPFPKEWLSSVPEPKDQINKEFMREVTAAILEEIGMSLVGLDFVIEESTGAYYVIDLNYFSSFRHEQDLSKIFTEHIVKSYNRRIRGKLE